MKKIILFIAVLILFSSFAYADNNWQQEFVDCPTSYQSQDCPLSEYACGWDDGASTLYCSNSTEVVPPVANATSNTLYSGLYGGGFLVNCYDYDTPDPFCNNDDLLWCNRNATCYSTEYRATTCIENLWGVSSCGSCRTNYNDCDTDGTPCEIYDGASCGGATGTYNACLVIGSGGTGNCTSATNSDCNNDDTDADESTCNGADGCEIIYGASCGSGTGTWEASQCLNATSGNCTSTTNFDCNNDDGDADESTCNGGDGCEISTGDPCVIGGNSGTYSGCTCISGNPPHHIAGNQTNYTTTNPNLWTNQRGNGTIFQGDKNGTKRVDIDYSPTTGIACMTLYGITANFTFCSNSTLSSSSGNSSSGDYVNITGDTMTGDLIINANLTISQYILSSLIPNPTLTLSLGSGPNRWLWLYVQNISSEYIDTYSIIASENITADWFHGKINYSDVQNHPPSSVSDIWVNESGDTMTGNLNMSGTNITSVERLLMENGGDIYFGGAGARMWATDGTDAMYLDANTIGIWATNEIAMRPDNDMSDFFYFGTTADEPYIRSYASNLKLRPDDGMVTIDGNVTAEWGFMNINCSDIQNAASDLCTLTDTDTDTYWPINATVLENQSGTLGINKSWFDATYLDDTDTNVHLSSVTVSHNGTHNLFNATLNNGTLIQFSALDEESTSGINGSGTINYLPLFTGATELGNSWMRQDNGSVYISGGHPLRFEGYGYLYSDGNTFDMQGIVPLQFKQGVSTKMLINTTGVFIDDSHVCTAKNGYCNQTDTDTNESVRFGNLIGNCSANEQMFGILSNGSKVCVADATGGSSSDNFSTNGSVSGTTTKTAHIERNDGYIFNFSWTDIDTDTTYTNATGINLTGTVFSISKPFQLPQSCTNGYTAKWNTTSSSWNCVIDWYVTGVSVTGVNPKTIHINRSDGVALSGVFTDLVGNSTKVVAGNPTVVVSSAFSGGTNTFTVNATRRTIQTFMGNDMADYTDGGSSVKWESIERGNMVTSPNWYPFFDYDFTQMRLNETYGYWEKGWGCFDLMGFECQWADFAFGVPFRREAIANTADIHVRFRISGGSAIGNCADMISAGNVYWDYIKIGYNNYYASSNYTTIATTAGMNGWTNLVFQNITLAPITGAVAGAGTDGYNERAWVVFEQATPSGTDIPIAWDACLMLESITVEQYNR